MRLTAGVFVLGIVLGTAITSWSDQLRVSTSRETQTENLQELKISHAHRIATLKANYKELEQRQECLKNLLDWASGYIPTLDIPRIKDVYTICYEKTR